MEKQLDKLNSIHAAESHGRLASENSTQQPTTYSATITLTQGKVALVDDTDMPLVAAHRWTAFRSRNTWYAKCRINGKTIYLHRLIVGASRGIIVDHINRDGLDNRRENLRVVTHGQNMMNSVGRRAVRGSAYKGVSLRNHPFKPFRACIHVEGKQKHLGYFSCEIDAARTYDTAALYYFGEHSRVNFSKDSSTATPRKGPGKETSPASSENGRAA